MQTSNQNPFPKKHILHADFERADELHKFLLLLAWELKIVWCVDKLTNILKGGEKPMLPTAAQLIQQLCDADNRHPMASEVTIGEVITLAKLSNSDQKGE